LLELDDGTRLSEGAAIVQYIADQAPAAKLAPANGTIERYKLQQWLAFIGTELHKNFAPLFKPGTPVETQEAAKTQLMSRFGWVDGELAGKDFLLGDTYTVADGYLFNVSNWAAFVKLDISGFANLAALRGRVAAKPSVQAAMKAEGLIK
jgi:glutathione S-transferase